MQDTLDLRPYRQGDEVAILQLFEQSYGEPMSASYWNWRFRDNPFAPPLIALAWDRNVLIAHYAVSPVALDMDGKPVLGALSGTTMTLPAYGRQGLFTRLAATVYDQMQQQGYRMVMGFPNEQSHRRIVRNLGWRDVCEIPMLRLEQNRRNLMRDIPSAISELHDFDARFDRLSELAESRYPVMVRRDSKYLTWRFQRNPQHSYRVLAHSVEDQVLGYAVFKRYGEDLDVVDLLSADEDTVCLGLMQAVVRVCIEEGFKSVNTWLPLRTRAHLELEKMGFSNQAPVTYFGCRVFDPSLDADFVSDARNWYYTMGDSDVF